MSARDGGCAFPMPAGTARYEGMSLRDYFAAAAMSHIQLVQYGDKTRATRCADAAEFAYAIADAMLAARGPV